MLLGDKKILNGRYYTDFILANIHYRISIILEKRELNKIKCLNKKQLREYSREIQLEKRKKIRAKKRPTEE
ncbi:conserved hypothetical protein [Xenorhabdus nematophila F1]|nr:conserved hypothetical protein [Xenorhabdus nematophila F1]